MKKTDIVPGMPLALAYTNGGWNGSIKLTDVRQGKKCRRGYVVGYGQFRIAQVGLCGRYEAIESNHVPSTVLVMAQLPFWKHGDPWELRPETEWTLLAIPAANCTTMAYFEEVKAERDMILLDAAAVQERLAEVKRQMKTFGQVHVDAWVNDDTIRKALHQTLHDTGMTVRDNGPSYQIRVTLEMDIDELPLDDLEREEYAAMKAEARQLRDKLECLR